MRNRFGGYCYECGRYVFPGSGHFERFEGGWRVKHALPYSNQSGAVSCKAARRQGETDQDQTARAKQRA